LRGTLAVTGTNGEQKGDEIHVCGALRPMLVSSRLFCQKLQTVNIEEMFDV
jgi:hypothetical protein